MPELAREKRAASNPFEAALERSGAMPLRRGRVTTLQVNVGKLCNQACRHCHVDAGPGRTENMDGATAGRVLELLRKNPLVSLLDLTGGAPEMNPHFKRLVRETRALKRNVCVRSNLTILMEPGYEETIPFFVEQQVSVVASLPCYTRENVDQQRGQGTFDASIKALQRLNAAGFGLEGSPLKLDLVYNPLGPSLPAPQASLQKAYKKELEELFNISFHQLWTITNMAIARFAESLKKAGQLEQYHQLLVDHFNPKTVPQLMCRELLSIGYDGSIHDCDFNQMLKLPLGQAPASPRTIWDVEDLSSLIDQPVHTAPHCFGCTAGAGSSCGGALA